MELNPIKNFKKAFALAAKVRHVHKDPVSYLMLAGGLTAVFLDGANPWPLGETILIGALGAIVKRGYDIQQRKQAVLKEKFWTDYNVASNDSERHAAVHDYATKHHALGGFMPRHLLRKNASYSVEILNGQEELLAPVNEFLEMAVAGDTDAIIRDMIENNEKGSIGGATIIGNNGEQPIHYRISYA